MKVLVTGANGFVGRAVLLRLNHISGMIVLGSVRRPAKFVDVGAPLVKVGELSDQTDWSGALAGVQAVVHTAARVHVEDVAAADPLAEFRRVNVEATLNLALQAAAAGVKRFVFLSSIKVHGEVTVEGQAFTEEDTLLPQDPYAQSKHEAEQGLRKLMLDTGMEVVILRPPLVYGLGVKANFAALIRSVQRGWPLPLGAVRNQRSLVALDNLVDLIVTCLCHPAAANQTFLVSDDHDLSTVELVRGIARAAGLAARLWPVPVWALQAAASALGKGASMRRLYGNLQVDISKARTVLGWVPPVSVDEGLRRALGAETID